MGGPVGTGPHHFLEWWERSPPLFTLALGQ